MDSQEFNQLFNARISSEDGRVKASAKTGAWIRDRLREDAFSLQIVPEDPVTASECRPSVHHDTLSKIIEIEPNSRATSLTFRGQPEATFISGARMEAAFYTISTELGMKTEQELLAYTMPITKIFEDNSVKDMGDVRDREWLQHLEAAVQAMQAEANNVTTAPELSASTLQGGAPPTEFSVRKGELARAQLSDTAVSWPMQRGDIVELAKMFPQNRLRMKQILFPDPNYLDILQWTAEDMGAIKQGETLTNGYTSNMLFGYSYARTIKSDICRTGNIYGFTAPDFLGKNFILNSVRFWIDKVANLILFQAWCDIAMAIVNVASVKKIETYSGDATAHDADSILATVTPVAESALGAPNNRVEQGTFFPAITTY